MWTPVLDPGSGEYYYYNNETEEQTWDKPEELMTPEEKEAAAQQARTDGFGIRRDPIFFLYCSLVVFTVRSKSLQRELRNP